MLQVAAPFPFTGAEAFTRGTANRVTILERFTSDGSHGVPAGTDMAVVKLHPPRFMSPDEKIAWAARGASLNHRFPLADLYETEQLAAFCGKPPKKRATRRRAR